MCVCVEGGRGWGIIVPFEISTLIFDMGYKAEKWNGNNPCLKDTIFVTL